MKNEIKQIMTKIYEMEKNIKQELPKEIEEIKKEPIREMEEKGKDQKEEIRVFFSDKS